MEHGTMSIMGLKGDTKITWDPSKPDEVENAKETFKRLKKKGYLAFTVKGDGSQGEQIHEFDPTLRMMILTPPMKGG